MYLKGGVVKKLLALALASFGLLFSASAVADGSIIGDTVGGAGQFVGNTVSGTGQFVGNTVSGAGQFVGNTVGGVGKFVGNTLGGGSYQNNDYQTSNYEGRDFQGNFSNNGDHQDYSNQEFCCGEPQEHQCGDVYCLYCKYEPCYYNEWRTVSEPKCYEKKCCRYVAKEYEKTCVKYVPQYYTQTCCRYEPEYFTTTEVRNCSRKVCDRKCKWVPKYYYKHICNPNPCEPVCQ